MLVATIIEGNETPPFSLVVFFTIATKRNFVAPLFLVIFFIATTLRELCSPTFYSMCMFVTTTIGNSPHFFLFHFVTLGTWESKAPSSFFAFILLHQTLVGTPSFFFMCMLVTTKTTVFFGLYSSQQELRGM